jgi:hypothetical protein
MIKSNRAVRPANKRLLVDRIARLFIGLFASQPPLGAGNQTIASNQLPCLPNRRTFFFALVNLSQDYTQNNQMRGSLEKSYSSNQPRLHN